MSRGTWRRIQQSNRFYVDTLRRASTALIFSISLSILLCVAIYHTYFGRSGHDFYATYGGTPPVPLTPMDQPNATSVPLLADDQLPNNNTNAVP